ncbi:MAG TPA: mandelate racemase/muconate lactonizing enzyme family protein [Ktedonobacterales bacterium]|nr:mandelate racemase/muconate lactonizing enzyme family protein [Ktedonobacterales bacterium]
MTAIDTLVVDNVPKYAGGRKFLFIALMTDEGIVGLGERVSGNASDLRPQISLLKSLAEQFVIGQNPFHIEKMWQRMFALQHDFRHPSMDSTPAISAIEMALWDIVGKATNQPIYNLLGGRCHEKLRAYAYMPSEGVWENPAKAGDIARQLVEAGFSACKIDPFMPLFPLPRDIPLKDLKHAASIFRYIREAVGDELEVAIGTHGQFSTAGAIRAAKVFEEYEPMWFEEPVPPEMVDEMARVASQTSIPIASGERLATKYEFASLIEKQAAGIIQVDVGQCGGILEAKKIAAIAEAHHALIAPHMFVGPIAAAAAIQLDSCSTNFMMQEFNVGPLHGELFDEPITLVDGYITPPSGPGLGLVLNDEVVRRHLSR